MNNHLAADKLGKNAASGKEMISTDFAEIFHESLILAQDGRWRRA